MPIGGYFFITATKPNSSNYLSGLDVLNDCGQEVSATVVLNPQFEDGTIRATIVIDDAKEVIPKCRLLSFVLPPMTTGHNFMLPTLHDGKPVDPDPTRRIQNAERPLSDIAHTALGNDILTVDLAQVPDFTGNVGFIWHTGLQRRNFSEWRLRLPFGAVRTEGDDRKGIRKFHVSMPISEEYRLKEKSVEPSAQRALENRSFYWFNIESDKPLLDLTFENEELAKQKERIKDICLVVLGVGVAVLIAELIAFLTFRKATHA